MQVVIDTAQTRLSVKEQCFYIVSKTAKRKISPKRISSIAITSNVLISASATTLAAQHQIPIIFFDRAGQVTARTWSPYFSNLAVLRKKQLQFRISQGATRFIISGLILKSVGHKGILKKLLRRNLTENNRIHTVFGQMDVACQKLRALNNQNIDTCRSQILGLEGQLSKNYWTNLSRFLPKEYQFARKSKRPAKDWFNAALNYLYGMMYGTVESAVFASGLDPMAGFLHTDNYKKTSLVFDLIEPFRPFVDQLLVEICLQQGLKKNHFQTKTDGLWLSQEGKKVLIPAFNEHLYNRVLFDGKVGRLKDHIFNYCSHLSKVIHQH